MAKDGRKGRTSLVNLWWWRGTIEFPCCLLGRVSAGIPCVFLPRCLKAVLRACNNKIAGAHTAHKPGRPCLSEAFLYGISAGRLHVGSLSVDSCPGINETSCINVSCNILLRPAKGIPTESREIRRTERNRLLG